jgi:hypothetical protein
VTTSANRFLLFLQNSGTYGIQRVAVNEKVITKKFRGGAQK